MEVEAHGCVMIPNSRPADHRLLPVETKERVFFLRRQESMQDPDTVLPFVPRGWLVRLIKSSGGPGDFTSFPGEPPTMPEDPGTLWRAVSVLGFLLLVGAYITNQVGRCSPRSGKYLLANILGAGLLAAYSAMIDEPVFVGLEGFWCLASVAAWLRSNGRGAKEASA